MGMSLRRAQEVGCWLTVLALCTASATPPERDLPRILVGANVVVWPGGAPQAEPFIAAHPSKPGVLVIGTADEVPDRGMVPRAYASVNGGRTWTRASLPDLPDELGPDARIEGGGDPWIAFDANGRLYFSIGLSIVGKGSAVRVYDSTDSGLTWERTFALDGQSWDAPKILPENTGGRSELLLIMNAAGKELSAFGASGRNATGLAVFRSADQGKSFAPTALIAPGSLSYGTEHVVQLANGAVLVLFAQFGTDRSTDAQPEARYYVARSVDGGRTFLTPTLVASVPRQFPDSASIAVDTSRGPFSGRVYATWEAGDFGARLSVVNGQRVREESGAHRSVAIARSDDQGQTWSPPVNLEVATAGPGYTSTVAVSHTGTVAVLWLQHERYEMNPQCYRTYISASTDGGQSFAVPVAVSDSTSCPARSTTQNFFTYRPRGGDYIGLAAAADGSFHATWSDARSGTFRTRTARIVVEGPGRTAPQ
jgi:hypothetical protein